MPVLDPCGFPLVHVPELEGYVHFLPITKIQYEYFLCDQPNPQMDNDYYQGLLRLNARTAVTQVDVERYQGAFVTGLNPNEALQFAAWLTDRSSGTQSFALLHHAAWRKLYEVTKTLPPLNVTELLPADRSKPRVAELIKRLDDVALRLAGGSFNRARQMFLQLGVSEWVAVDSASDVKWGLYGVPARSFGARVGKRDPEQNQQPERPDHSRRMEECGFRLFMRSRP